MRPDDWITQLYIQETILKNKFYVNLNMEIADCIQLSQQLQYLGDTNTLLVVCSPDYSSLCSQVINHNISKFSKSHLPLDMVYLNMPYPTQDLKLFESEIIELLERSTNYDTLLFIDSGILRGLNFKTLKEYVSNYTYKSIFACLYKKADSVFIPDHFTKEFPAEDELVFWWEDAENPNWK